VVAGTAAAAAARVVAEEPYLVAVDAEVAWLVVVAAHRAVYTWGLELVVDNLLLNRPEQAVAVDLYPQQHDE